MSKEEEQKNLFAQIMTVHAKSSIYMSNVCSSFENVIAVCELESEEGAEEHISYLRAQLQKFELMIEIMNNDVKVIEELYEQQLLTKDAVDLYTSSNSSLSIDN